jgi:hypothetical protein
VGCVDGAPPVLGGLDELERHGDAGGPGAGSLGDPLAEPDGGEGRLDRVRGAQVDPVLGGAVVEGQQDVEVIDDLRDGLGPLRAVVGLERFRRFDGVVLVLGVVDLRERSLRAGVRGLGQRSENVAKLVPLMPTSA